jgi:diphthamide biosynthesis enzyme Dph1/Dph2-like protein
MMEASTAFTLGLLWHAGVDQCIIMGDVTYGACCVDDFSARECSPV